MSCLDPTTHTQHCGASLVLGGSQKAAITPGLLLDSPGPSCPPAKDCSPTCSQGALSHLPGGLGPGAQLPQWKVLFHTHPSPHWSPQQVSMSSADTSTLTCPLVRMQIRSEMASTAPNACRKTSPAQVSPTSHRIRGPQRAAQTLLTCLSQCQ